MARVFHDAAFFKTTEGGFRVILRTLTRVDFTGFSIYVRNVEKKGVYVSRPRKKLNVVTFSARARGPCIFSILFHARKGP